MSTFMCFGSELTVNFDESVTGFLSIRGLTKKVFRASLELVSHKNKNVRQFRNEALEGADLHLNNHGGIR